MTTPSHERSMRPTITVWQPTMAWASAVPNTNTWTPEGNFAETLTKQIETYKHVLRALGGYWQARFKINADRVQIERWLGERLGWHIEVYNEAQQTIFEGFVNRIDAVMGGFAVARGPLLRAANKLNLAYRFLDTTTSPPTPGLRVTTGISEDNAQQQRYGIIEENLSGSDCTAAEATQTLAAWLVDNSRPRTTMRWTNVPSGRTAITVTVFGYVRLMESYIYEYVAATGTENMEDKIDRVLNQDPNNLFASTNADIAATGVQVTRYDDKQRTAWAIIKDLVARGGPGPGYARYLFGIWANRRAGYAAAPTVPEYHIRISDVAQRVETPVGVEVFPWNVLPGKWALVTDFLIGRAPPTADPRQDPRALFIEQATYTMPWALAVQCGRADRVSQMMAQKGLSGLGD